MRLTHLRSFYGVAVSGSFTGAAKMLHISQSTVTAQVRSLEDTYGGELFYRRGRHITLTQLGNELLAIAKPLFSLERDAIQLLKDAGQLRSGQLRVGAVGPFHVTKMLAAFNQHYPGIRISVQFGNSQSIQNSLIDYQTDVAVLAHFMDNPLFHSVPYSRHPVVLLVNSSHRLAERKSVPIEELDGERLILREEGSTTRRALEDALTRARVNYVVVMEIGSREAIREAVIMGMGIGVVSKAEYVSDPRLRVLTIHNAHMYTHAHVLCLEERRSSGMIRAFLNIVDKLRTTNLQP